MKYQKNSAGHYVIKGKTYELLVGSRAQVMHGTAYKTTGELTRDAFIQNKHGRIVSKSKYRTGKNKNKNNLLLNGYTAKKGKFGAVRIGSKTQRRRKGHRGGTTDPSNSGTPVPPNGVNEGTQQNGDGASPANIPVDGVAGYQPHGIASSAASFSGGRRRGRGRSLSRRRGRKTRGGLFLGGNHLPLSPADF